MKQYVIDIIGDIVLRTESVVLPKLKLFDPTITNINYQYGIPTEITNTLSIWTNSEKKNDKYPLIALFENINEKKGKIGVESELILNLVIARETLPSYNSYEREINNFRPILDPVYDEFLRQLYFCGKFINAKNPKHIRVRNKFWGKNGLYGSTNNVFNDKLDAIEIQNIELTLHEQC